MVKDTNILKWTYIYNMIFFDLIKTSCIFAKIVFIYRKIFEEIKNWRIFRQFFDSLVV